jgi:hypothetical protein
MAEASGEAKHKGRCDIELLMNNLTRREKTEADETLYAEIDQIKAPIAKIWARRSPSCCLGVRQEEKNIEPET